MDGTEIDEEEFGFSRNYFLAKEQRGTEMKSRKKLSDMKIVEEQVLREAMLELTSETSEEIQMLLDSYKKHYPMWLFELRFGFGLLMYGFGSKKSLLEDFASTALSGFTVVVLNGYLQSININQVLAAMAELLWDQLGHKRGTSSKSMPPFASHSRTDLLAFLNGSHTTASDCFVCMLIHNIDGPALRDSESQEFLAQIASCCHVRVVASVDHVNSPLLWDKKMVHLQFNWCWYHVPTYAPYTVEGVFYPLVLVNAGSSQSAKTASIVLHSLTPNARSLFAVLAEYQLGHPDEEGVLLNKLYMMCRERFIVSSQVMLNSHLTEFKDHDLVKTRRNDDGQECLYIPLPSDCLQKILKEFS